MKKLLDGDTGSNEVQTLQQSNSKTEMKIKFNLEILFRDPTLGHSACFPMLFGNGELSVVAYLPLRESVCQQKTRILSTAWQYVEEIQPNWHDRL